MFWGVDSERQLGLQTHSSWYGWGRLPRGGGNTENQELYFLEGGKESISSSTEGF